MEWSFKGLKLFNALRNCFDAPVENEEIHRYCRKKIPLRQSRQSRLSGRSAPISVTEAHDVILAKVRA